MRVFKASNVGDGIKTPYKKIEFETNMRLTSPFTITIENQQHTITLNKQKFIRVHPISLFSLGEKIKLVINF